MKKLLTAYVICIYSIPISYVVVNLLKGKADAEFPYVTMCAVLLTCVLALVNIAVALISLILGKRQLSLSLRDIMVFKLILIPYYIGNYVLWLVVYLGSALFLVPPLVFYFAPIFLLTWATLPFVVAFTYLTMLGTSAHAITKLVALRRDGAITTGELVIHILLQLTFVLDVADSIYLAVKQKSLGGASTGPARTVSATV